MSKFKNIEKLGLSITTWGGDPRTSAVLAQELETLLQSAQVVYGSPDTPSDQLAWSNTQLDCDTHKALLIAAEPIKKKTKAEAALELLQEMVDDKNCDMDGTEHNFFIEAKRILNMKDEV